MKHLGDITKLNGHEVPLVDIVTGGSPCQDLSIAGLRKGLEGERSGLFMEQIRVIKEMRNECIRQLQMRGADEPVRPRYMVWENVLGAFISNGGEDFRCVLEETARIADPQATIPRPPKGKWNHSGAIMGDGWSIAWRVHDAQFWGVPQRRKRIALVADFGGDSATEILFERRGLLGNTETSQQKEKPHSRRDVCAYSSKSYGGWSADIISQTIRASGGDYGGGSETLIEANGLLRRKTPLETERLFGFPDGWTDIGRWIDSKGTRRETSDALRYKALGNSIALPFWEWMAGRMVSYLPEGSTMASLFDGIGGFPLVYSRCGCTPVWASEIEEFPMAVTRIRFGEE